MSDNLSLKSSIEQASKTKRLLLLACLFVLAAYLVYTIQGLNLLRQEGDAPGAVYRLYGEWAWMVWGALSALLSLLTIGVFAWPAQWLFPAPASKSPKIKSYEFWLDILFVYQGLWLGFTSLFVAVGWLVSAIYGDNVAWFPQLAKMPFWVQVVAAIWAFDFAVYWRHRFEHTFSVLWSFHAVHHTTEKVDFMTTTRLHPFELALGAIVNASVIRAGFDPAATGLAFFIYLKYNYFVHSNIRVKFPGIMKYIFVSPFMHHWHHAKDMKAAGKNVGVVFAWNDFLFGTAYHPADWPEEYGFTAPKEEQVGQSYIRQMLYPLQFLYARMISPFIRRKAAT